MTRHSNLNAFFYMLVVWLNLATSFPVSFGAADDSDISYAIVDTGQQCAFDDTSAINPPEPGDAFFGQDACYAGLQPSYRDNGDGTISDLNTKLMWQSDPGEKKTFQQAKAGAKQCRLGGYDDWRLPTIKELYSLIDFNGGVFRKQPYLDTNYFKFEFGDPSISEREIDSQYWSATEYVATTMGGNATVFGVNFADGRIKGYPRDRMHPNDSRGTHYVIYVRGNPDYGKNKFHDNGDGTITDQATGLSWMKVDSGALKAGPKQDGRMNWRQALEWAENLEYAGFDDWRLPNAKELQSIVDYSFSPGAEMEELRSAAIDPIFDISDEESYFWTGTTHWDGPRPDHAAYLCFGRGMGHVHGRKMDVHGAGAQRSDPKSGDPAQFPDGFGPQGDDIRIDNYARCVRDGGVRIVKPKTFADEELKAINAIGDRRPQRPGMSGPKNPAVRQQDNENRNRRLPRGFPWF